MTNSDFDKVFKNFDDVKGLENTKMEFFIHDFKKFIEVLMNYEKVHITHLFLKPAPKRNPIQFLTLESYYQITIDEEIQSLYNQVNQLQLRWIHENHPKFNKKEDLKFSNQPFDSSMIDIQMGAAQYINITDFTYFLKKWPNLYVDYKEAEGYELYYLNYDHHFSGQLAVNLNASKKCLEFYTGDDYFADVKQLNISFADYMYKKIAINDTIINNASKE